MEDVINPVDSNDSGVPWIGATGLCAPFYLSYQGSTLYWRSTEHLCAHRTVLYAVWGNENRSLREETLWRARLTPPPPASTSSPRKFTPISSQHPSAIAAARRITELGLAVTSHRREGWAPPREEGWVLLVCERYVYVQRWLDGEGGGERKTRISEPSERWLGADTTPPRQGLNILRDQTHLWRAWMIISSMGPLL